MEPQDVTEAQAIEHVARAYEDHARRTIERFESARRRGVPERQLLVLLCAYDDQASAIDAARRWADASCGTFVLAGPIGTGKSLGAAHWADATGAHWVSAVELAHLPIIGLGQAMDTLVDRQHLVIDEVGGQGATHERGVATIGSLLARRHEELRATVVTTNLTRDAFAQHLDGCDPGRSRLCDRIAEAGEWLNVRGASRRAAPVDTSTAVQRLTRMRRFLFLLDPITEMARDLRAPNPKVLEEMRQLCKATDEKLAAARVLIAEQSTRIDGMLGGLLRKWEAEDAEEGTTL